MKIGMMILGVGWISLLLLPTVGSTQTAKDDYQRSAQIYRYQTSGKSGAPRGEEIYYYKCWMCHNKYTKGGPPLADLYQRKALVSGQPVNDDTVKEKIRSGGPKMPRFGTTLVAADLDDLVSYLKGGKCCFEGDDPPPNPNYRSK